MVLDYKFWVIISVNEQVLPIVAQLKTFAGQPKFIICSQMKKFILLFKTVKITLVMDNFKTHDASALYETFEAKEAKRLWDRLNLFIRQNMEAGSIWLKLNCMY